MTRGSRGSTCNRCGARVVFFGNPFGPGTRPFQPAMLNGHRLPAHVTAYPVYGGRAWRLSELVEHLMVQRGVGHEAAEGEARDVAWYQAHTCPPAGRGVA